MERGRKEQIMKMEIAAIVVVDNAWAIGSQGGLLCHLPADLKHFKATTMGYPIIMGRKTFESFPKGPLPGRLNIILTRSKAYEVPDGAVVCHSAEDALAIAAGEGKGRCFIIGGGQVYADFADLYDELFLTRVYADFPEADTYFPAIDEQQWTVVKKEDYAADERNPYPYSFVHLKRNAKP